MQIFRPDYDRGTISRILTDTRFVLAVYLVATLVASWLAYVKYGYVAGNGLHYKDFNTYVISKQSFFHLLENKNLYVLYPAEHWDLYKYSPTFALFMGLFAYLPDSLGLALWNLLNALPLYLAINSLPVKPPQVRIAILWFVLLELIFTIQHAQING